MNYSAATVHPQSTLGCEEVQRGSTQACGLLVYTRSGRKRVQLLRSSVVPSKSLQGDSSASMFLVASLLLVAMPFAPSSFLLLLVRHLLLEAMHLFLVASLLLVAMSFAPSSFLLLLVSGSSSDVLCS